MNEPATGETTPQEKGNTQGNSGPGKCRRKSSGGGGGGAPQKPGLCKGNHLVAAEAQARPGCLEKLLSSLTPFMKQEGNISSV